MKKILIEYEVSSDERYYEDKNEDVCKYLYVMPKGNKNSYYKGGERHCRLFNVLLDYNQYMGGVKCKKCLNSKSSVDVMPM